MRLVTKIRIEDKVFKTAINLRREGRRERVGQAKEEEGV
jgi:hypothetical protein